MDTADRPVSRLRCPWCGYGGAFRGRRFNLMFVTVCALLLFPLVIPGFLYAIWYASQLACPCCGAHLPRGPF